MVLTFGSSIDHDSFRDSNASTVLYVFPPNHYVVTLLCFCLCVVLTVLYPVINFPALNALKTMLKISRVGIDNLPISFRMRRYILTLLGMVFVAYCNLGSDSLLQLFGLCGSWGVGMVCYVIPLCTYLKICKSESLFRKIFASFGIIFMLGIIGSFTYFSFSA